MEIETVNYTAKTNENKFPSLTSSQQKEYHQKFSEGKIVTRDNTIPREKKTELT